MKEKNKQKHFGNRWPQILALNHNFCRGGKTKTFWEPLARDFPPSSPPVRRFHLRPRHCRQENRIAPRNPIISITATCDPSRQIFIPDKPDPAQGNSLSMPVKIEIVARRLLRIHKRRPCIICLWREGWGRGGVGQQKKKKKLGALRVLAKWRVVFVLFLEARRCKDSISRVGNWCPSGASSSPRLALPQDRLPVIVFEYFQYIISFFNTNYKRYYIYFVTK